MKKSIAFIALICAAIFAADAIDDSSLGLSKTSVNADSGLQTTPYSYNGVMPGPDDKNKRVPRAYDNAPPMIPHDVVDFTPITKENNACLGCHMPETAAAVGAIAIPKSHMTNLRTGKDLKGALYEGRYNCTQCHAPQANLNPAVANKFKGAFKTGGQYKTNLINVIQEGVVVDTSGQYIVDKNVSAK